MLVQDMKACGTIAENTVKLQQLGDKRAQFLSQYIRGIGLGNKAGNIFALGHPDARLAVPLRPNFVNSMPGQNFHFTVSDRANPS